MPKTVSANINPKILIWAREEQGLSLSWVAEKFKKIEEWEAGSAKPTMKQLRDIAHLYKRPSAVFFLKNTPEKSLKLTDFRSKHILSEYELSPSTLTEFRLCESRRKIAIELAELLGEDTTFSLPKINLNDDPEQLAIKIANDLYIDYDDLRSCKTDKDVLGYWIDRLENANVLVFHSITKSGFNSSFKEIRGASAYHSEYPWVWVNSQEHPRGQLFTLGHELTHLLLQSNGICTLEEDDKSNHVKIERFCNSLSAALLMPKDIITTLISKQNLRSPDEIDTAIDIVQKVFHTSKEAIARRFVTLNLIKWNEYNRIREEQIQALIETKTQSSGGDGKLYYKRVLSWNGYKLTSLVTEAYHSKKISLGNAVSILGTKVSHFEKIVGELYG